ncbi:hypothetical protein A4X03_0g5354 [Tilletia caries]|uniref:Myosin motor domain-containing protein n=1 Tax=Tilletia caries TaxID=13290 RepID=A0A8T8T7C1_9BASI|nr:hypothetical protein A4X03_0g5354 [Tilletia caries]
MARGYALQHPLLRATSTSHHHLATTSSAVATASCPIAQPPRPVGLTVRSLRPILGPGVTNSLRTSTSSASLRVRSSLGWGAPSSVRMPGAWDALADYENAPTKSPELEFGVAMRYGAWEWRTGSGTDRRRAVNEESSTRRYPASDDATSAASSVPSASTAVTLAAVDLSTWLSVLAPEERTFHVFYQLPAGATQQRDQFHPDDVTSYALLAQSGCYGLPGGPTSDDSMAIDELRAAMKVHGFKAGQTHSLHFQINLSHAAPRNLAVGTLEFADPGACCDTSPTGTHWRMRSTCLVSIRTALNRLNPPAPVSSARKSFASTSPPTPPVDNVTTSATCMAISSGPGPVSLQHALPIVGLTLAVVVRARHRRARYRRLRSPPSLGPACAPSSLSPSSSALATTVIALAIVCAPAPIVALAIVAVAIVVCACHHSSCSRTLAPVLALGLMQIKSKMGCYSG